MSLKPSVMFTVLANAQGNFPLLAVDGVVAVVDSVVVVMAPLTWPWPMAAINVIHTSCAHIVL